MIWEILCKQSALLYVSFGFLRLYRDEINPCMEETSRHAGKCHVSLTSQETELVSHHHHLLFRLVGCDALCYVVLDVVIEDGVVVLVVALWSGELHHFIGCSFGVRHDCATGKTHLGVTIDVAE